MNLNFPFLFNDDKKINYRDNVFFSTLTPNIFNKEQLFNAYYYQFHFPTYFGYNWDALNDCLNDFSWMEYKIIFINHISIPHISDNDLFIYLKILFHATYPYEAGFIKIYTAFPYESMDKIQYILAQYTSVYKKNDEYLRFIEQNTNEAISIMKNILISDE